MRILKGYVFRLYPNQKQKELIEKTIESSRFIYNYFLEDKIKEYKEIGKRKSAYDQIKLISSLNLDVSSQIYSVCNDQNKEVKDFSIRSLECSVCHTIHDRDFNASVNIMLEELKKYRKGVERKVY